MFLEKYLIEVKRRMKEKKKKEPKWLNETKKSIIMYPDSYKLGDRKVEDLTEADFDFQGFIIPQMTLRKALLNIGFKEDKKNNRFYIENDNKLLNTVPLILQDDGMGYGTRNRKMTDFYLSGDEKGNSEVHIWF